MRAHRSRTAALAALAVSSMVLAGCAAPGPDTVAGSTLAVATAAPFTSYNPATAYGDTPINHSVSYATNSGFAFYNDVPELVRDESFGSYVLLNEDPMVVEYTINDGVKWSDGTAVDGVDLLLNWLALSGAYNQRGFEPTDFVDEETGLFTEDYPDDVIYFDSGADQRSGAGLVSTLPDLSDDHRTVTMTYDIPYVDWELDFMTVGVPAHVIAQQVLGIDDAQEAKDAILAAIRAKDESVLAPVSAFWNTGFNLGETADPDLLVSNGPYVITGYAAGEEVVLTASETYIGDHRPQFEELRIRYIADPLAAVQALQVGEVQVATPPPTAAVVDALKAVDVRVIDGIEATHEHLDLQFDQSMSGFFADPLIREAFMLMVPRTKIVQEQVRPLSPGAQVRDSFVFLPGTPGYKDAMTENGSDRFSEVDIDEAVRLLAQAGVPNPTVCILYAPGNPRRAAQFAMIKESAALAGFNVTDCSSPDWRDLLGTPGAYDAALFGWQTVSLGATDGPIANFRSDGPNNLNFYASDEMDDLLDELAATFDVAEREQLLLKVDALLWADRYGLPIFQFPAVTAFDPAKVSGIKPSVITPTLFWNVWEWSPIIGDEE